MGSRVDRLPPNTSTPAIAKITEEDFTAYANEAALRYRSDYAAIVSALQELSNNTGLLLYIILTANIPAASASLNGRVFIEDGGSGVGNLIFYKGGQRFRLTGASF